MPCEVIYSEEQNKNILLTPRRSRVRGNPGAHQSWIPGQAREPGIGGVRWVCQWAADLSTGVPAPERGPRWVERRPCSTISGCPPARAWRGEASVLYPGTISSKHSPI